MERVCPESGLEPLAAGSNDAALSPSEAEGQHKKLYQKSSASVVCAHLHPTN